MADQCVISRQVKAAAGVFAPGHLGELTRAVPFEMVDQALAATGTTQARIRVLPARAVVCLLLAGCLFAELGYRQVWHKLTAGLGALPVARPGDNALWRARARLGAAPLRWLFDLRRGPATAITAGPVRWRGLLVCAIDGTTMIVPDSPRNLAAYGKQAGSHGGPGYPLLRLVALVACGTRTIIDAVFGPFSCGELDCARRLARGRVPRARSPAGIAQEVYALLTCYQILRIAITTRSRPPAALTPAAAASPSPSTPPVTCSPRPPTSSPTPPSA